MTIGNTERIPFDRSVCFNELFYKLVGVPFCSSVFPILCSKVMIKLMKNHGGVFKFFPTHHMNGLGLGNVTPGFLTVFLRHSNLQMRNINIVMLTKSLKGFVGFFYENQLHDSGFEQMLTV